MRTKLFSLICLLSTIAQASFLSISLDDQTIAPNKRHCTVGITLSSNSHTAQETFKLTRLDDLRTVEMGRYNLISINGFITLANRACPAPLGTSVSPNFTARHEFDEQVYAVKIRIENNPQDLNGITVEFLESRLDHNPDDF